MKPSPVDVALGAALALGVGFAAWAFRQEGYWSDGRSLVEMVDGGAWNYHNLLYLPAGHFLAGSLGPFGLGTRGALEILSAGATGLAVAFTYAAARVLGIARVAACSGALVLATAPAVWFYATCVEVHSLELTASAGVLLALVVLAKRGILGASALPISLAFCLLAATHVSGALCAPALAFLALRGRGRWAWPRHVPLALVPVGLLAAAWIYLQYYLGGSRIPAVRFAGVAVRGLGAGWSPGFAWHELVVEGGMLYPIAAVLLVRTWRRDVEQVLAPLPLALLVLVACFVPFAATYMVPEHGGYFVWALPALAVCASRLLDLFGALRLPLAAALVGLHLLWATEEVREWAEEYPGYEWVPTLVEEVSPDALVLTLYSQEWIAVRNHTDLEPVRPPDPTAGDPALSAQALLKAVGIARARGRTVVILRSLYEFDFPDLRQAVEELERRFGPPRPGRHPEYLVFDGSAPAR
jgi:hypothetical protein